MKFETLITRYKNLGYNPKNVEEEVELECLINWIYKTYDIFIYVHYYDFITVKCTKKHLPDMKAFSAHKITHCNTEYSNKFYSDKHFYTPYEAKFHTVKETYKNIRFLYH